MCLFTEPSSLFGSTVTAGPVSVSLVLLNSLLHSNPNNELPGQFHDDDGSQGEVKKTIGRQLTLITFYCQ